MIRSKQFHEQELLKREAWRDLRKSREPRTEVTERVGDDGEKITTTSVVEGLGKVEYSKLILQAQSEQRELCGMNYALRQSPAGRSRG